MIKDTYEVAKEVVNSSAKLSHKVTILICLFVVAFVANWLFGFSTHYYNTQKIDQITKINELLKDTSLPNTSIEYIQLSEMRRDILLHEDLISSIKNIFKNNNDSTVQISINQIRAANMIFVEHKYLKLINEELIRFIDEVLPNDSVSRSFVSTLMRNSTINNTQQTIREHAKRNNFLFLLTCSWSFFLIILISPITLFVSNINISTRLFAMFNIVAIMLLFSLFHYWIFGYIPMFGNSWLWNYIVNVVLHAFLLFIYCYSYNKLSANKKQDSAI